MQVLSLRHVAGVGGGPDGPAVAPRKLRELRIEGDPHLRQLPLSIGDLQHLRARSLRGCPRLAGLHLGLAQHTLQRLNICLCWELEASLPVEELLAMPCLLELCTSQQLTPVRCALCMLHMHCPALRLATAEPGVLRAVHALHADLVTWLWCGLQLMSVSFFYISPSTPDLKGVSVDGE